MNYRLFKSPKTNGASSGYSFKSPKTCKAPKQKRKKRKKEKKKKKKQIIKLCCRSIISIFFKF